MKQTSQSRLQSGAVVGLLALVCCFLWGSAFPCIKIGYELFSIGPKDSASQILFAGVRFSLAGVLTLLIGSVLQRRVLKPAKGSCGMIFRLCLAQTVFHYLLFYIGLAHTSGVKGSIITGSNVFFSILISSLICHFEALGRSKLMGCVLGFAGVVLINLNGTGLAGGVTFLGEGFMLLSALSSSVSSVLIKSYSQKENPVTLSGSQFLMGGLIMTGMGLLMGGRLSGFTPVSVLLLTYMAMISAVAYSLWSILLKHNPVGKVAVYGFLTPICGVILSALILREQNQAFTAQGLVSLALVCVGIYLVNRDFSRK